MTPLRHQITQKSRSTETIICSFKRPQNVRATKNFKRICSNDSLHGFFSTKHEEETHQKRTWKEKDDTNFVVPNPIDIQFMKFQIQTRDSKIQNRKANRTGKHAFRSKGG